jgi:hypothetical protein
MVQAFILFVLGVSGSIFALYTLCSFINQVARGRSENACQCRTYFDWILRYGSEEQKKSAEDLLRHGKLEDLKKMVGSGILVKP